MSMPLTGTFVELRCTVSTDLLEKACQVVTPYVVNLSYAGNGRSPATLRRRRTDAPVGDGRYGGLTRKEIDALLG